VLGAVTLDTGGDTGKILIYAAIAGAITSLVGELLVSRGRGHDHGGFEIPRWRDTHRWYDLGSAAAIPIGVVAACLAALLLVPIKEVVAASVTTRTVELDKLLGVAGVAGLSSAAFLRVVQERFIAAAKTQELRGVVTTAAKSLPPTGQPAGSAAVTPAAVRKVVDASTPEEAMAVAHEIAAQATEAVAQDVARSRAALLEAV
jgi:hypothetical protein